MSGLRIGGLPLHPALVHFPVAAWCVLPALDVAVLMGAPRGVAEVALWVAGLGLAAGLLAMIAGFVDLAALEGEARRELGTRHMLWMGSVWTLALVAALLRVLPLGALDPRAVVAPLDALVLAGLVVGGHLGGRLVYELGLRD